MLSYLAQCSPLSRTLTVMPTWSAISRLSDFSRRGQSCMPKQPFFGAPTSISLCFRSVRSGSTLCRMPVVGSTLGNLHLDVLAVLPALRANSLTKTYRTVRHDTSNSALETSFPWALSNRTFLQSSSSHSGMPDTRYSVRGCPNSSRHSRCLQMMFGRKRRISRC